MSIGTFITIRTRLKSVGLRRTSILASSNVSYGVIPNDHWNQPEWIDEERATAGRNKLVAQNIIYGGASVLSQLQRVINQHYFAGSVS